MNTIDRITRLLGIDPATRQESAADLFLSTEKNPMVYWLELLLAVGIAHFGLILNSTAVIIGAMLISPLMTPIVQLGMAFTLGNFYFALKATRRILLSMAVVTLFAALITMLMPFQEITGEILARTQPTALDLLIALCCGLAASFTTAKHLKNSVTAAAGTAIAIALVPPLCVIGFGVGILSGPVVLGSSLLFITNLVAIIVISNLFFILTGFNRIDVKKLEEMALDDQDRASKLYILTKNTRFVTKVSRWKSFRFILPVLFIATLSFPLSKALQTVAWELNTKKRVSNVLDKFEKEHRLIRKQQVVSHGTVAVRLTVVGDPGSEPVMTDDLKLKLAAATGTEPVLSVEIIPSTEYVKRSSEMINRRLASLSLDRGFGGDGEKMAAATSHLTGQLRNSVENALRWIRSYDTAGQILDWALQLKEKGNTLLIERIGDQAFSDDARSFISGILKEKTGIDAPVLETWIPRRLFESDKPDLKKVRQRFQEAGLKELIINSRCNLEVSLRNPGLAKKRSERALWQAMNDALRRAASELVPQDRLIIKSEESQWGVRALKTSSVVETTHSPG